MKNINLVTRKVESPVRRAAALIVFCVCVSFSFPAFSQVANGGRNSYDFLKISPVSRALGVGGAYTALGDDVGSIYYNPAGLASLLTSELNFTYLSLYQSMSYEFIAFAYPLGEVLPGIGGTLAVSADLLQPGSQERTNDFGVTTGTFSSGDQIFTLAYAKSFGQGFHAGASVKMIHQQIDTVRTTLFAADAGIVVIPAFDGMRLGLSIKNIGASSSGFDLPFTLNGGISYRKYEIFDEHDDGAITAEAIFPFRPIEDPVGIRVGIEYAYKWVGSRAAIRGGYSFLENDLNGIGLTLGAGYGLDFNGAVLFLDYAFAPADIFGSTHRISLTTKF